jgi:hypothetical protein
MPFRLAERAIFPRGHGGRRMVGSQSGSLFEHADRFGFGRVRFGGDRPVSEFATSYQRPIGVTGVITESTSLNEMAKIVLRQRD